jgi:hypothetical protein
VTLVSLVCRIHSSVFLFLLFPVSNQADYSSYSSCCVARVSPFSLSLSLSLLISGLQHLLLGYRGSCSTPACTTGLYTISPLVVCTKDDSSVNDLRETRENLSACCARDRSKKKKKKKKKKVAVPKSYSMVVPNHGRAGMVLHTSRLSLLSFQFVSL